MNRTTVVATLICVISQYVQAGPAGANIAASAAAEAERQRQLYRQQQIQNERNAALVGAQKEELQLIYSKDPWRSVDGATNSIASPGWVEFQGIAHNITPDGVLFQGKFGPVLSIHTDNTYQKHLAGTDARIAAGQTGDAVPKVYGEDFFVVKNFPYPVVVGLRKRGTHGYEQLMAFAGGYCTYTNPTGQVLTLKLLDYGTPCTKIWSQEEIAAAGAKKQAVQDKVLKSNMDAAARGDAYGLMRMGERYRDGEGVDKDLEKAKTYLQKAANAGSPTAAEELKALPTGQ
ncbi:MAG: sel1 repeat family protein [Verrucomicrobia bacterium]|nr:sel1 repeat family protein [Verrucomicrobiota bacterium]